MEYGLKKLNGNVTVLKEPGLLRITIRPGSGLAASMSLKNPAVFISIAAVILIQSDIFNWPGQDSKFYLNLAIVIALAAYVMGRVLRQAQVIEVWQGELKIKERGLFLTNERRYDLARVSAPGLNIPPGKNHPGYLRIPKGGRVPDPSLSFFYGAERELVNFAPGVERLSATYILELLRAQGLK